MHSLFFVTSRIICFSSDHHHVTNFAGTNQNLKRTDCAKSQIFIVEQRIDYNGKKGINDVPSLDYADGLNALVSLTTVNHHYNQSH